jgi:hypothetical protein
MYHIEYFNMHAGNQVYNKASVDDYVATDTAFIAFRCNYRKEQQAFRSAQVRYPAFDIAFSSGLNGLLFGANNIILNLKP